MNSKKQKERNQKNMREYNVESIEAKYRADLEELNQYAVIVPLAKEDIGAYIKDFETMDEKNKVIMAIEHKEYPCYGVQFHPESIASVPYGKKIIKNFLKI